VGQVVVTATRTRLELSDVPQSTTVITRDEIASAPERSLPEIIQRAAGVQVNQNGPLGSLATVQIRGSEAQQVLVLVNGRRLNDAQSGLFDLSSLPVNTEDVERIEILRGGASALYGADAMGGVVNVITRSPTAEPQGRVSASIGRFGTQEYTLSHRWKPNAFGYALSISREQSQGYRTNGDLRSWKVNGEIGYQVGPGSDLNFSVRTVHKEIGTPGTIDFPDPDDGQKDDMVLFDLGYHARIDSFDLNARVYQNFYDRTFETGPLGKFSFGPPFFFFHKNRTTGGDIQVTTPWGSFQTITSGVEGAYDLVNSSTELGVTSTALGFHDATRAALFLQDEIEVAAPLTLTLGLRYDYHSAYQGQLDPRAALLLRLPWETRVRASVARSFRAPTFDDLYWPADAYAAGNPGLGPEKAWSYELGAEKGFGRWALVKAAIFYRDVENLIRWAAGPDGIQWRPDNVAAATVWGAEVELTLRPFEGLTVPVTYTHLYPRDETNRKVISDKPEHMANLGIEYAAPFFPAPFRFTSSVQLRYVRYHLAPALPDNALKNREYLVVDARVALGFEVQRGMRGEVSLALTNALDRSYQVSPGYPMPPRSFTGGASLAF
jgi:outer membrane cobalamin receptor